MGYSQHPCARMHPRPGPGAGQVPRADSHPQTQSQAARKHFNETNGTARGARATMVQVSRAKGLPKRMAQRTVGSQEIQGKRCRTQRRVRQKSAQCHSEKWRAGPLRIQRSRLRPRDLHSCLPSGRSKSAGLTPHRPRRSSTGSSPTPNPRPGNQQMLSRKIGLRVPRCRPRYVVSQIPRRRPRRRNRS